MQIEINTSDATTIDWGAVGVREIAQNVLYLISTMKYEVAYDRTLGIRQDFLDMPLQESIALATAQIYGVVEAREPRATVTDVQYIGITDEGNMNFRVVIEI